MNGIESRQPRVDYDAMRALNISRLKEMRRSPQHYLYALDHPKTSDALTLGIATHTATLEPERWEHDFAVWRATTANGSMSPRKGQAWEDFCAGHLGKTILTPDQADTAQAIALAVRGNPNAMKYLYQGEPEVRLSWEIDGRPCKGRVDWITRIGGRQIVVGLKTTRDCRHFAFAAQSAKLAYHWQWAWYFEGYKAVEGVLPGMVEIVAESAPPYAVAVYLISDDILAQGWDECQRALETLRQCEASGEWPGPVPVEEYLTLPSWAYPSDDDDISDLGLEGL